MCKYFCFGLKQHREKQYAFRSYFLYRSNPYKVNEAILVFGDVHGQVNALLFSAATMALFDRPSQPAGSKQGTVPSFVRAIFVWPWKMVSVSVRYLFYQPMDEMIKTWTLRFPAKENPNMDKVLFDWPIVLQYDVKAKNRLISRKFSGMKFFHLIVRLTNQKPRSFVSVP